MTGIPSGVPQSIRTDGWWLREPNPGTPSLQRGSGAARWPQPTLVVGLVALADLMFWGRAPGISLALFALAVLAAAYVQAPLRRVWVRPALMLIFGALPVVEYVQPFSVAFLAVSLVLALIWLRHPAIRPGELIASAMAFVLRLPARWLAPLRPRRVGSGLAQLLAGPEEGGFVATLRRQVQNWAFPLGGTLVLMTLLLDANPILAQVLTLDLDGWAAARRAAFWAGVAILLLPFLSADLPAASLPARAGRWQLPGFGINAGSVLRGLVLFNLLIGVQMITDASILLGGAALPRGMSYADYAHRGAYPLLATAMLAGAFALLARPFLAEHRAIRPLMLLWLGQNVVLCGAAALRLELYIGAYGLTYLRLHALIWMGLVAAGLALTALQALRDHSIGWLVWRAAALGLGTLYLCSFVNFANIIAAQNLRRELPDLCYICDLGPMAKAALAEALATRPDLRTNLENDVPCAALGSFANRHWQEWGFRKARMSRYLAPNALPEHPR